MATEAVAVGLGILLMAGVAKILQSLGLPPIVFWLMFFVILAIYGLVILWIETYVLGQRGETRDDRRTHERAEKNLASEIEANGPVIPPMGLARYNQTLYPEPPVPQPAGPTPESRSEQQPGAH